MGEPVKRWVVDLAWRALPPDSQALCRMPKCRKRAVAELNRGRRVGGAFGHRIDMWWPYCEDHLYGRKLCVAHEIWT